MRLTARNNPLLMTVSGLAGMNPGPLKVRDWVAIINGQEYRAGQVVRLVGSDRVAVHVKFDASAYDPWHPVTRPNVSVFPIRADAWEYVIKYGKPRLGTQPRFGPRPNPGKKKPGFLAAHKGNIVGGIVKAASSLAVAPLLKYGAKAAGLAMNPGYQENPHIVFDSNGLEVESIHRGNPMKTFNTAFANARAHAAKLRRPFYVVAHPYVPKGWKHGTLASPLFFAGGPYIAVLPDGSTRDMNGAPFSGLSVWAKGNPLTKAEAGEIVRNIKAARKEGKEFARHGPKEQQRYYFGVEDEGRRILHRYYRGQRGKKTMRLVHENPLNAAEIRELRARAKAANDWAFKLRNQGKTQLAAKWAARANALIQVLTDFDRDGVWKRTKQLHRGPQVNPGITPAHARKLVASELARLGLPAYRLSARTVGFSDLARGSRLFVTIHGWKPDRRAEDLKRLGTQNGFSVSFQGAGIANNPGRFQIGDTVQVMEGSGLASGTVARIVRPFPWYLEPGAYKPVPKGWYYLEAISGDRKGTRKFTHPGNRLVKVDLAKVRAAGRGPASFRQVRMNPCKTVRLNPNGRKRMVSLPKFIAMVQKSGNRQALADLRRKIAAYKRWTHGSLPKRVLLEKVNTPGVSGMMIGVHMGKQPEALYSMPKNSKRKGAWRHPWGTMPDLIGDPKAGIIMTRLRGKSRITDFLHR